VRVAVPAAGRVRVGVGVLRTHAPASVHAESNSVVQPVGQPISSGTVQTLPSHWQQSSSPGIGVSVGVGVLATQAPASLQAESRTGAQPIGQAAFAGTSQVLPSHWQQSFGPSVGVAVCVCVGVRVGVLAMQLPDCVSQAESRTPLQPSGHVPSVGTLHPSTTHSQQSSGPRVGVGVSAGVLVGVTVLATQPISCTQAASKTALQPEGQAAFEGTAQTTPSHWQQSFGPSVGVTVGVGVLATQAPLSVQAESNCGVQPLGHAACEGTTQVSPSHWQQSLGPSVGVTVGVGVLGTQPAASMQAASKVTSHSSGQAPPSGTAHAVPSHWQQSFGPGVRVGVGPKVQGSASASTSATEIKPSQLASEFASGHSGQRLQSKTRLIRTGRSSSLITPSQFASPGRGGLMTVPQDGSVPHGAPSCA
jgi:hypothetical protein